MKLFASELKTFPDPRLTMDEGIVDLSDDLRVERLLEAYSFGIFPWPHQDLPTLWYCPEKRGVLDFADLHMPHSFQKWLKKTSFRHTFNTCFETVIESCARLKRQNQTGTWITGKLLRAYKEFHKKGYAHSLEVWDGGDLVGGLYGVYVGGVFCGESMFHRRPNASKFALAQLVEFLSRQGLSWIDIQMVTPLLQQFGGKYIDREDFLARLEKSKEKARPIFIRP
jgi:leucyl/phenylalanyl-tRNA--protein transferase